MINTNLPVSPSIKGFSSFQRPDLNFLQSRKGSEINPADFKKNFENAIRIVEDKTQKTIFDSLNNEFKKLADSDLKLLLRFIEHADKQSLITVVRNPVDFEKQFILVNDRTYSQSEMEGINSKWASLSRTPDTGFAYESRKQQLAYGSFLKTVIHRTKDLTTEQTDKCLEGLLTTLNKAIQDSKK